MHTSPGFFINPTIIQEVLSWRANTGESLAVFEPIAKALDAASSHFAPASSKEAGEIHRVLESWCSSHDFHEMLSEAAKRKLSIGLELARESLSGFSGSDSFVNGIPVYEILTFLSAFLRAELRNRESRASVRMDELFIYNSFYRRINLHDMALSLFVQVSSGSPDLLNRLIQIKEDPSNLHQIEASILTFENAGELASALRMFALSNFDGALKGFARACTKAEQELSAHCGMVFCHFFLGEKETALEKLAELAGKFEKPALKALSLLINNAGDAAENQDIQNQAQVLAFLALQNRNYNEAREILESYHKDSPDDPIACMLFVESQVLPLRERLALDPPLPSELVSAERDILEDARERLANMRSQAYSNGLLALQSLAETNLAHVALLLRDFSTAFRCALAARASLPENSGAKINQASAALAMGNLPVVMSILDKVLEPQQFHAGLLLAEAYFHASALEEACAIWKQMLGNESNRLWRMRILCRLLESYRLLREQKNAQSVVDELLAKYQDEPEVLFSIAYELWQIGRCEDALGTLRRASEVSAPNLRKWISWELGRFLFEAGQNLSATDEYVSISDKAVDSVQGREFAVALYKAGLLPAAYERAKALRLAHGDVIPGISEIETDYLVRTHRIPESKELLERLCELRPLSVLNRMALVRICYSLGQKEAARAELDKLRQKSLTEDMKAEIDRFISDLNLVDSLAAGEEL